MTFGPPPPCEARGRVGVGASSMRGHLADDAEASETLVGQRPVASTSPCPPTLPRAPHGGGGTTSASVQQLLAQTPGDDDLLALAHVHGHDEQLAAESAAAEMDRRAAVLQTLDDLLGAGTAPVRLEIHHGLRRR